MKTDSKYFDPKTDLKFEPLRIDEYEKFIGRLKKLVEASGMKQKDLAEQIDMSPQQLAQYMNSSRKMGWEIVNRLAKAGYDMNYLFNGKNAEMINKILQNISKELQRTFN